MPRLELQPLRSIVFEAHREGCSAGKGVSPLRAEYDRPLQIVSCLVALVLLAVCATIAGLFEARRAARQRELAVRVSAGASRWRLLRQPMAESLLLASVAALFGLILAHWTGPLLVRLLSSSGAAVQLDIG